MPWHSRDSYHERGEWRFQLDVWHIAKCVHAVSDKQILDFRFIEKFSITEALPQFRLFNSCYLPKFSPSLRTSFLLCFSNKSSHQPFPLWALTAVSLQVVKWVYSRLSSLPRGLRTEPKSLQQVGSNPAEPLLGTFSDCCQAAQGKGQCLKVVLQGKRGRLWANTIWRLAKFDLKRRAIVLISEQLYGSEIPSSREENLSHHI